MGILKLRGAKHLNAQRRERYKIRREQILNYQKSWKQNNLDSYKMKRRLADLREQQKALALQLCKNKRSKEKN